MEIRLGKIFESKHSEEVRIEFDDILTDDQFQKLKKSVNEIENYNYIIHLSDFVKKNHNEMTNYLTITLEKIQYKSTKWNDVKRKEAELVFFNINRLFLNYLSSMRTFLDHSEAFLSRKFGKESSQFLEFKKLTSVFYDNSFAYRFFYKLRNYAQHIGLPLSRILFATEYNRKDNQIKGSLNVLFDRDKLLLNYDGWGVVKSDLETKEKEFDAIPLICEMTHNMLEIRRNTELILKMEFIKASQFITELTKYHENGECEIFIAHDFETKSNGELKKYKSMSLPFEIINNIRENF